MTMLETERWSRYEEMCPWHHRQPFNGAQQHPRVIKREDAAYLAWAPDHSVVQPVWCYVSTHRVNAGTFDGPHDRNEGFPSHLDDLAEWPPERPTKGPLDMQHLPESTWLHVFEGIDRRKTILVSFFYCDERIRCAKLTIPRWGESKRSSG